MPTTPTIPPLPGADARKRRADLHARVDSASAIGTPSQVAYIRGRQRRWTEPELAEQWAAAVVRNLCKSNVSGRLALPSSMAAA